MKQSGSIWLQIVFLKQHRSSVCYFQTCKDTREGKFGAFSSPLGSRCVLYLFECALFPQCSHVISMQSPYVLNSDVFNCRRICLAKTAKATPWRHAAPVMAISSDAHSCIQLLVTDTWCHHWGKGGYISWSPVNNLNFRVISLSISFVYLITSLMCNTDCTTVRLFILECQRLKPKCWNVRRDLSVTCDQTCAHTRVATVRMAKKRENQRRALLVLCVHVVLE